MLNNEGDILTRVVVCSPLQEYFRISDCDLHNITQLAEKKKALQQHDNLKSILESPECEVIDIPELYNHPNSVFTRDTALCTPKGYIKLRMGLNTRRGEEDWMAQVLDSIGETHAGSIEAPGTVEGGDVILAGSVAFIGQSQRTNENGLKQISSILSAMDYEVRSVKVPSSFLHIGGAMSIIGQKKVLYCKGIFPDNFFEGFEKIEISNDNFASGNVICLGNNEVIADIANVETIKELKLSGIIVHTSDLSEFIKGTGGPSCLVMPVERE
ncbi:MAG: arginine deiminase family protein [Bacteroidota bacterium]